MVLVPHLLALGLPLPHLPHLPQCQVQGLVSLPHHRPLEVS